MSNSTKDSLLSFVNNEQKNAGTRLDSVLRNLPPSEYLLSEPKYWKGYLDAMLIIKDRIESSDS